MSFKRLGRKSKQLMAFLLAVALLMNNWISNEFAVFAEDTQEETLEVTLERAEAEYTGERMSLPQIISVVKDGETLTTNDYSYIWYREDGSDIEKEMEEQGVTGVGTFKIKVTIDGTTDYGTAEFVIKPLDLANYFIYIEGVRAENHISTYTGDVIDLTDKIDIKDVNGQSIFEKLDREHLRITATTGKNVGDKINVTVEPCSDDTGTAYVIGEISEEFEIETKNLKDASTEIEILGSDAEDENGKKFYYTGNAKEPEIKVTVDGTEWVVETDYTVEYSENIKVSTEDTKAKIRITPVSTSEKAKNYTGVLETTFRIVYVDAGELTAQVTGEQLAEADTNWYTGNISISAPENWEISTDEVDWKKTLEITELTEGENAYSYSLRNSSSQITGPKTEKFYVDRIEPEITKLEIAGENAKEWAAQKTIEICVEEENLKENGGVYYVAGEETDIISLDENGNGSLVIKTDIPEEGKEYTFYVVDKAGHKKEQSIIVSRIDAQAPFFNIEQTEYWKNNEDLELSLGVSDGENGSGLSLIECTLPENVPAESVDIDQDTTKVTITNKVSGVYEYVFIAKDAADNFSQKTIVVKVDITAPVIEVNAPEEETIYEDEDGVFWFAKDNVSIPVIITDAGEETQKAPYEVTYSTDNFVTVSEVVSIGTEGDVTGEQQVSLEPGINTYTFKVKDAAGNISETQIQLGFDGSKPNISNATLTQNGNDNWINQDELGENEKVAFLVEALDEQTGIQKIEYSIHGDVDAQYQEANFTNEGNGYTFVANETISDSTEYDWWIRVTNHVNQKNTFQIGGGIDIDATVPDNVAYIKISSDTVGDNSIDAGNLEDGKWSSKIWEMVSDAWNKIWGREEIQFEVYVKDNLSGIADIQMSYNGDLQLKLKEEKGLRASFVTGDGSAKEEYTAYKGSIVSKETLVVENFKIDSITDKAGNTTGDIVLSNASEQAIIYLDAVAPTLQVTSNLHDIVADVEFGNVEKRYFANADTEVTLTIEERFFQEKGEDKHPKVVVESREHIWMENNHDGWQNKEAKSVIWSKVGGTEQWQTTIVLPKVAEKEIEYRLSLEYADSSGNLLTGRGVTNGQFTSSIFVVDAVVPTLIYGVSGNVICSVSGNAVYKNIEEKDDLEVTVTVSDNENYFDENSFQAQIVNKNDNTEEILNAKKSRSEGREHTYTFGIDGALDAENEYFVRISYIDKAGNALTKDVLKENSLENGKEVSDEGIYESNTYVIDHKKPLFDVTYEDAVRVIKDGVDVEGENAVKPQKDHTAYYSKENPLFVTFAIEEIYTNFAETLEHYLLTVSKDGVPVYSIDLMGDGTNVEESVDNGDVQVQWNKEGIKHTITVSVPAKDNHSTDGDYQITFSAKDCAGNLMEIRNADNISVKDLVTDGIYISPILILDTTAPQVTVSYNDVVPVYKNKLDKDGNLRNYYEDKNTTLLVTVTDRNLRYQELVEVLQETQAVDINGTAIKSDKYKKYGTAFLDAVNKIDISEVHHPSNAANNIPVWKLSLPLLTEANYTIPVDYYDLAGNRAVVTDQTQKNALGEYTDYAEGFVEYVTVDYSAPELKYDYKVDAVNYWEWGFLFAPAKMTINVTATDNVAGIFTVQPWVLNIYGETMEVLEQKAADVPVKSVVYEYTVPMKDKDFKGGVSMNSIDYAGNEANKVRGHIVETKETHSKNSTARITTKTEPSRSVDGMDYYNTDVKFNVFLQDTYSGIAYWECTGGDTINEKEDFKEKAGSNIEKDAKKENEIQYKVDKDFTLDAGSNNKNELLVKASLKDNAGHETVAEEKEYNIDTTKPTIEVTYDNNEPFNEFYYNKPRIATVKITERNFNPDDVEFMITSTDGVQPSTSGWSSSGDGDEKVNSCTVTFEQDSDYTFTLEFTDMAGNTADYSKIDEFTIDTTIPEMTVTYNNNDFLNENYYNATRVATIDIVEHNFDPTAININITANGTIGGASISSWSKNGDHNTATVTFSDDAEYTFDIEGVDMANNELADYEMDQFIVDQTVPELEIFDIEDMSANNGEVRPGIRYFDENYDPDGTVVIFKGYHNGVQEMKGDRVLQNNGLELKLYDIPHTPANDDIYTMEATVYDMAGNSSEASVMFSVNRFGSVYTFNEATEALVGTEGKYYTNKAQDIIIKETNVDTLEFKEITCNLNGRLTTLTEGQDYLVDVDGSETTWKQYTYTIFEDNFEEEGTYIITTYSEDKAKNSSDNNSKGKSVEFVLDKTKPSVLISGVENEGQYREDSREMTVDIEDNIRLSEMVVSINGEETTFDAVEISELDGKITMNIESDNHWQDIKVTVKDAAGNETVSEELKVLVSANLLVQFVSNKPVLYTTTGTASVSILAVLWFILRKRVMPGV